MPGLYSGLRREEIIGLQRGRVYLDVTDPCLSGRRAWQTGHNRHAITEELKTREVKCGIPIPDNLSAFLRAAEAASIFRLTGGAGASLPVWGPAGRAARGDIWGAAAKRRALRRFPQGKGGGTP